MVAESMRPGWPKLSTAIAVFAHISGVVGVLLEEGMTWDLYLGIELYGFFECCSDVLV